MNLKHNQFYQSSYLEYRNFHGTDFSFRKNSCLRNLLQRVLSQKLITSKKVFGTHLRKHTLKNAGKVFKIVYIHENRTCNVSGNHFFVFLLCKIMFYQKLAS